MFAVIYTICGLFGSPKITDICLNLQHLTYLPLYTDLPRMYIYTDEIKYVRNDYQSTIHPPRALQVARKGLRLYF